MRDTHGVRFGEEQCGEKFGQGGQELPAQGGGRQSQGRSTPVRGSQRMKRKRADGP